MKAILKKWVFSLDLNSSIVGQIRRSAGRLFQRVGAASINARSARFFLKFNVRIVKACSIAGTAKVIDARLGDSDQV